MIVVSTTITTPYSLFDNDLLLDAPVREYVLRVKDLPDDDRPREKLMQLGARNLSIVELLAVLWGVGTRKEEVLVMARRILKEYGEAALIHEDNPNTLSEALNIPVGKACQLIASFELGRRFYAESAGLPVFVRNAEQAFQYLQGMGTSRKEQLRGLYLSSRYEIVHDEVISVGSLTSNVVHPREVFAPALEFGAIAIIIAHNHPSGSLQPTEADKEVTRQLKYAGQMLGIDLLDHLIITKDKFMSLMEEYND